MSAAFNTSSRIAIPVSCGALSLLGAFLLRNEGSDPFCVHFYIDPKGAFPTPPSFSTPEERQELKRYADAHELFLEFVDLTQYFDEKVLDPTLHARIKGEADQSYFLWLKDVFFPSIKVYASRRQCKLIALGVRAFLAQSKNGASIERWSDLKSDQSAQLLLMDPFSLARTRLPLSEISEGMVQKFLSQIDLPKLGKKPRATASLYPASDWTTPADEWIKNRVPASLLATGMFRSLSGFTNQTHAGFHTVQVGDVVKSKAGENGEGVQEYVVNYEYENQSIVTGPEKNLRRNHFIVTDFDQTVHLDPFQGWALIQIAKFDDPLKEVPAAVISYSNGMYEIICEEPLLSVNRGQVLILYLGNSPVGIGKVLQSEWIDDKDLIPFQSTLPNAMLLR